MSPGQTQRLFDSRVYTGLAMPFDIFPDGNRIVFFGWTEVNERDEPLVLVKNWKKQ